MECDHILCTKPLQTPLPRHVTLSLLRHPIVLDSKLENPPQYTSVKIRSLWSVTICPVDCSSVEINSQHTNNDGVRPLTVYQTVANNTTTTYDPFIAPSHPQAMHTHTPMWFTSVFELRCVLLSLFWLSSGNCAHTLQATYKHQNLHNVILY